MDICRVACESCNICHTSIHICCTNGMTYSFVLVYYRLMALRVFLLDGSFATIVEEELCLVKVFLVACDKIQAAKSHLCNLMTRNNASLTSLRTNFANHAVGISYSDIQELAAACGLIVSYGTFYHMTEVVEFVA